MAQIATCKVSLNSDKKRSDQNSKMPFLGNEFPTAWGLNLIIRICTCNGADDWLWKSVLNEKIILGFSCLSDNNDRIFFFRRFEVCHTGPIRFYTFLNKALFRVIERIKKSLEFFENQRFL